jgi:hypothetical protein
MFANSSAPAKNPRSPLYNAFAKRGWSLTGIIQEYNAEAYIVMRGPSFRIDPQEEVRPESETQGYQLGHHG